MSMALMPTPVGRMLDAICSVPGTVYASSVPGTVYASGAMSVGANRRCELLVQTGGAMSVDTGGASEARMNRTNSGAGWSYGVVIRGGRA